MNKDTGAIASGIKVESSSYTFVIKPDNMVLAGTTAWVVLWKNALCDATGRMQIAHIVSNTNVKIYTLSTTSVGQLAQGISLAYDAASSKMFFGGR